MEQPESYTKMQERIKDEQKDVDKDKIQEAMEKKFEHAVDLNNLPKQEHNWVDRGAKMSCEGANHPHHSHFKFKR